MSGRVQRVEGDQHVVVRFLDASRRPLADLHQLPVTTSFGRWERWSSVISVPSGARWATFEVASGIVALNVARWDDIDLRPAAPVVDPIGVAQSVSSLGGYLNTTTSGRWR